MREPVPQSLVRLWRSSVLFSGLAVSLRIGVHVILLPLVLVYLTPQEQAIWWVFVALGNFITIADFGFGQTITRVYNILWAGAETFEAEGTRALREIRPPNTRGIAKLNQTVQHLYRCLSAGAVSVLAVGGTFYLYNGFPEAISTGFLLPLWACYLLTVAFNFSSSYWWIACQGIDRVREVQLAQIWSSVAFLIVVVTCLSLGGGLVSMVFGAAARGLVLRQVARRAFYKVIPPVEKSNIDFGVLRRIWPNARRLGILSITGYWAANGLVLISGVFLDVPTTASVGATSAVGNMIVSFAGIWLAVKWPQITIYRTQGKLQEMSFLFARRFALSLATFIIVAAAAIFGGNWLLEWKQSTTRLLPWPYLLVYLLYLFQQFIYVQFAALVFTENVVPFCKISLFTCGVMIALSLALVPRWGLLGLILSPFLSEALFSAWIVVRRGFSSQSMGPQQFFRFAVLGRP